MKCRPVTYAVITGDRVTYGMRCRCGEASKRFSTPERRNEEVEKHGRGLILV